MRRFGFSKWLGIFFLLLLGLLRAEVAVADPAFFQTPSRRFFSEEFIVFGKDPAGQDFLLTVMLCRKEDAEKGSFIHYRFASLISSSTNIDLTDSFYDDHSDEVVHGFLNTLVEERAEDLSSRESYTIGVELEGRRVRVKIPELQGDFVVKDSPDFSKHLSESVAQIQIGDKEFTGRAAVEKIYSSDYSIHVFFPGYGKTPSETNAFVLWDEAGGFYVLDASQVTVENPNYRSHTWVLWKDTTKYILRKGFEAHISAEQASGQPMHWAIRIPPLEVEHLDLTAAQTKKGKPNEGIVHGQVQLNGEKRFIAGYFVHHVYP